jgi:hypothetical protein
LAITLWFHTSGLFLIAIYVSNFWLATIAQVTMSAEGSLIPRIVKSEHLLGANSIFQASMLGAQGAGIVLLAPLLLKLGGAPLIGGLAGLLCLLSAGLCARLPVFIGESGPAAHDRTWKAIWDDLRAGWRLISTHTEIRWAIAQLVSASALSLLLLTLLPGWVSRGLGFPVENVAYLAVPGGIGFGSGMWLIGKRGHWLKKEVWASIGLLAIAAGLGVLPCLPALRGFCVPLYLLASTGIGAGFALVVISGKTILQEHSPNAMRGRVLSSQLFLSSVVSTLPLPLMGKLADVVGFQRAFALLAFIVLIIGIASVRHAIRNRGASPTPLAEAEPFESPRQGQGGATKSKRDI